MKTYSIFALLAMTFTAGCSDRSESTLIDSTSGSIVAQFAGASFVSVITSSIGSNQAGVRTAPNQVLTFGRDSVISSQSGVTEIGDYAYNDDGTLLAQLPDRTITFSADGGDLIWDSRSFKRAASAQFDSQPSLAAFLDGSTYTSVEQLDVGESAEGELVLGNWSISVIGDQFIYSAQDTVLIGTYSYLDGSSFTINGFQQEISAVVLDQDQLVVDSVTYEKNIIDQFDSQESMVNFLDGKTYKSVSTKPVSSTSDGLTSVGYWFIDFTSNTYSRTLEDGTEAGTVGYINNSSFSAVSDNQSYTVEVENDDIVWDGTRYTHTVGE
jgi:hypothetical protein